MAFALASLDQHAVGNDTVDATQPAIAAEDGVFQLDAVKACKLMLFNSVDYERQVEELYDAMLEVRRDLSVDEPEFSGILETATNLAQSIATDDYSVYQQAGRVQIHGQLSVAEREFLRTLRKVERLRRMLYVGALTGKSTGDGTVNTNSTGATFVGGYYGLLKQQQTIRDQRLTVIRLRDRLAVMEASLIELLSSVPDNPAIILHQRLHVAQAEQALLKAKNRFLVSQSSYETAVDRFKRTIGLPASMRVKLDAGMIDAINLFPPSMLSLQERVASLRDSIGEMNVAILESGELKVDPDTGLPAATVTWNRSLETLLRKLQTLIDQNRNVLRNMADRQLDEARADIATLKQVIPQRKRDFGSISRICNETKGSSAIASGLDPGQPNWIASVDSRVVDPASIESIAVELDGQVTRIVKRIASCEKRMIKAHAEITSLLSASPKPDSQQLAVLLRDVVVLETQDLSAGLFDDVSALSQIRSHARIHRIRVLPVELPCGTALEIASRHRRDWLNARAALVASKRRVGSSDASDASLDLVFGRAAQRLLSHLDSVTRLRVHGGDFQIQMIQERRNHSPLVVEYEKAIREYNEFVDNITIEVASALRALTRNQLFFELQRSAALSALRQCESANDLIAFREARGQTVGSTDVDDMMTGLENLQTAHSKLANTWIKHEAERISLDFALGTMRFDSDGAWVDPGAIDKDDAREMLQSFANDPAFIVLPDEVPSEARLLGLESEDPKGLLRYSFDGKTWYRTPEGKVYFRQGEEWVHYTPKPDETP
jgi:hypothetical protein